MKMLMKALSVLMLVCCVGNIHAEIGRYGADAFTLMGPGSRAQGMGGAFCALADDVTAVYWNPAGLPQIKQHQLYMTHMFLFGTSQYDFVALSVPMPGKSAFALSWTGVNTGGIPEYPSLKGSREERMGSAAYRSDGTAIGTFNDMASLYQFTFAKAFTITYFTDQLELFPEPIYIYAGVGMKRYMQVLYGFTGSYTGIDVGLIVNIGLNYSLFGETPRRDLNFAVAAQNVWDSNLLWNTLAEAQDDIPQVTRLGVSYTENLVRYSSRLVFAYQQDTDYTTFQRIGAEYIYRETIAVRGGYVHNAFTAGMGLHYRAFGIGYAFNNHELDALHTMHISYVF